MAFLQWLIYETSLYSLIDTGTRDTYLILVSRFLRMFAYGGCALVLALYLYASGLRGTQVGTFMTIALLGDAVISYLLSIRADKIGRRRVLTIGSALMIFSGTVFALTRNYYMLLFAAIVGVITPGAHEVGPFRAVQESVIAHLTPVDARTDVYAWFAVTSTIGMSTGLYVAGHIFHDRISEGWEENWKEASPPIFWMYAIIGVLKVILTLFLTERCETDESKTPKRTDNVGEQQSRAPLLRSIDRSWSYTKGPEVTSRLRRTVSTMGSSVTAKLSPESKGVLIRLSVLFAVNSFASGMLPVTIMAWYLKWWSRSWMMHRIGYAMSAIWLVASIATLFSAAVARRLGLVRTMVLVHLPNAIFLGCITFSPHWTITFGLLMASSALGSMDQAPRMAFVAAVFPPEERTAVMGTLNLVRTVASAWGPFLSGYLYEKEVFWLTFIVAATLKVGYDIGLLVMFRNTALPEQDGRPKGLTVNDLDVDILLSENLARPEEFDVAEDDDDTEGDLGMQSSGKPKYAQVSHVERYDEDEAA